jgi:hypothetical protein
MKRSGGIVGAKTLGVFPIPRSMKYCVPPRKPE